MWSQRCYLESLDYKDNYFVTLTYNDDNLPNPSNDNFDDEWSHFRHNSTLSKRDIQLFLKKLRRHYDYNFNHKGIRFLLVGEYGPKTNRPHYHAIFFNLPFFDLKKLRKNPQGD